MYKNVQNLNSPNKFLVCVWLLLCGNLLLQGRF